MKSELALILFLPAVFSGLPPAEVENLYWLNIDKYHLSYLYAEESPQKIAEKERLESKLNRLTANQVHSRILFVEKKIPTSHG